MSEKESVISLSTDQYKAIRKLEKAFKLCAKVGVKICGMNDNLIYATDEAIKFANIKDPIYGDVPDTYEFFILFEKLHYNSVGHISHYQAYKDSGGW